MVTVSFLRKWFGLMSTGELNLAVPRRVLVRLLVVVLCCGCMIETVGAADARYAEIEPDQFLKEWLLLGPIPAQEPGTTPNVDDTQKMGYEQDLLAEQGGEAKLNPEVGKSLTARGGEYEWTHHSSTSDIVDLNSALGQHDFAVAYAAATIDVPEPQSCIVGLGSDDAVRVWLNGELVHENPTPRAVTVDDDVFPIKLQQGTNRLLLKVVNYQVAWGFTFRFLSPENIANQLFKAASTGNSEKVEQLASFGIDLDAKADAGLTAAQIAKARGYEDVVDLLVSKGAAPPDLMDASSAIARMLDGIAPQDAPGVAVLIARDGEVLFSGGFGLADLSNDVPITPQTKFRIGSITKQFTAAAILQLQEEGLLSVEDKLSKYFPDFPRGDEVTIHHLLTHTSGIKSFTSKPDFLTTVTMPATSEKMIESFENEPFDFDPGTKFAYNNSGYFLLGVIVEKVSGQSYDDFLKETFFDPLEMHDTGVHTATAILKHEATGYEFSNGKLSKALDWDMSRAGAAGCLYSTVEDLMRWNEGVFGGKVLSENSLQAAFTPVTLDSEEEPMMSYGYGWIIGERRGLKTISHGGGLNGWSSQLTRYVDENTTIVVLHNALPSVPRLVPGEVAELLADLFLWQDMQPRPRIQEDETTDPATFAAYVGRYDYAGAVMDIMLDGEQLTAQLTGQQRFPIYPAGGTKFFWKVVDAQIEFIKDDDGKVVSARHTQGGQSFVAKRLPDEKEMELDEQTLNRYVGKYQYPGDAVLTVRREDHRLFAQLTGQPELEIFAKAPDVFFWKVAVAEIKFVIDDDGKVEKAMHTQSGSTFDVKKIE